MLEEECHGVQNEFRLTWYCIAHKAHTAYGYQWGVHDSQVSGIVNLSLAMRPAGSLRVLRTGLRMLFQKRLQVFKGCSPPAGRPSDFRAAVLGLYFGDLSRLVPSQAARYMLIATLLNGDWEQQDFERASCLLPFLCSMRAKLPYAFTCFEFVPQHRVRYGVFDGASSTYPSSQLAR